MHFVGHHQVIFQCYPPTWYLIGYTLLMLMPVWVRLWWGCTRLGAGGRVVELCAARPLRLTLYLSSSSCSSGCSWYRRLMHYIIIPLVLILTAFLVLRQYRLPRADVVLHTRTYVYHIPFLPSVSGGAPWSARCHLRPLLHWSILCSYARTLDFRGLKGFVGTPGCCLRWRDGRGCCLFCCCAFTAGS